MASWSPAISAGFTRRIRVRHGLDNGLSILPRPTGDAPVSVALTTGELDVTAAFTVTATFSEGVTGFALDDLLVTNGEASNLEALSASVYTFTVTPSEAGDVTARVLTGAAESLSTGVSSFSSGLLAVTYAPPEVTSTVSGPDGPLSEAFTATLTFSESVTGLLVEEIVVTNGAASNLAGSGASYTVTITPTVDGEVGVAIPEGIAASFATGVENTASNTFTVEYDGSAPTLELTTASLEVDAAFEVTATFSEDVTGFTVEDITVTNGSASNFAATSASVYTFDVAPDAEGDVTVSVAGDAAEDAATSGNTPSNTLVVAYDPGIPSVLLTTPSSDVAAAFEVTATFSESVTGLAVEEITVTNGAASNLQGSGASYTFDVTPTADGEVTVQMPADAASDGAHGNTPSNILEVTYAVAGRPEFEWLTSPTVVEGEDLVATFRVTDSDEATWAQGGLSLVLDPDGAATAGTVTAWAEASTGVYEGEVEWAAPSAGAQLLRGSYTDENALASVARDRLATVDAVWAAPDIEALDYYYGYVQLRSDYTGALARGYRESDAAEMDFPQVNGRIDTDAMVAFAEGDGTGIPSRVLRHTWYAQKSTVGINLVQTNPALMPVLVEVQTDDETGVQQAVVVRDSAGYVGHRNLGNAMQDATYGDAVGIPAQDTNDLTLFAIIQPTTDTTKARRWVAAIAPTGNNRETFNFGVSSEGNGTQRIVHGTGLANANQYDLVAATSRGLYVYRQPGTAPVIRRGNNVLGTDPVFTTFTGSAPTRLRDGAGTHSSSADDGFDGVTSFLGGVSPALDTSGEDAIVTAMNVLEVAPVGADPDALLPQNTQAQVDLYAWHKALVQSDFDIPYGSELSYDDTGLTDEEVAAGWWAFGAGYSGCKATHAFLTHSQFYKLDGGVEFNGQVYLPTNKQGQPRGYVYGEDCAWIYALQAPGLTNPYFEHRGVGLRALVCSYVNLISFEQYLFDSYWGRWEGLGKMLLACAPAWRNCRSELTETARDAFVATFKRYVSRLGEVPSTLDLVNKESDGFEALGMLVGQEEGDVALAAALLPTAEEWLNQVFEEAGYVPEGRGMEPSYEGRTDFGLMSGIVHGAAAWLSAFATKLRTIYKTRFLQHIVDEEGSRVEAGSAMASRTSESTVRNQMQDRRWRDLLAAYWWSEGKPVLDPRLGSFVPTREEMVSQIQGRITSLNTSAHEKSFAPGGYAGAVYNVRPSIHKPNMFAWPDQYAPEYPAGLWTALRGLIDAADPSTSLQMARDADTNVLLGEDDKYLWFYRGEDGSGRRFSFVRSFISGVVYEAWGGALESFQRDGMGITSIGRHDKGGGGTPTSDGTGSATPENTRRYGVMETWLTHHLFSAHKAEIVALDPDTDTIEVEGDQTLLFDVGNRYRVQLADGETEWAEYADGAVSKLPGITPTSVVYDDGTDRTVIVCEEDIDSNNGDYDGITVGSQLQWTWSTAISNGFAPTPTPDGSGGASMVSVVYPLHFGRTLGGSGYIPDDVEAAFDHSPISGGERTVITVTAGVLGQAAYRPALDYGYDPVFLRDDSQSVETAVEAWDYVLEGWVLLDQGFVLTDEIRKSKNGVYEYIHLSAQKPVRLLPRWIGSYQQATHGRTLVIDLHDDRGTPTTWEASVSLTIDRDTTAPVGLTAVAPSAAITFPSQGQVVPAGEPFLVRGDYRYGDAGAGTVVLEHSEDGETWTEAATPFEDQGGGEAVHAFDAWPGPGEVLVRVKVTPAVGDPAYSYPISVASTLPTPEPEDTFTDTDGMLLSAHTPDADPDGSGWLLHAANYEIQSGRATPSTGLTNRLAVLGLSSWRTILDVVLNKEGVGSNTSAEWPRAAVGCRRTSNSSYVYVNGGLTSVRIGYRGDGATEVEFPHDGTGSDTVDYRFRVVLYDQAVMSRVWVDGVEGDPVWFFGLPSVYTTDNDRKATGIYGRTGQTADEVNGYTY